MLDLDRLSETGRRAMDYWGKDAQLGMVAEECGELIVAVSHHHRGREGAAESLIEEGADALITIMQLRLLAPEKFDAAVSAKLRRLECRLEALHA